MEDSTQIGMNKTGMQMHPMHAKRLMETVELPTTDETTDAGEEMDLSDGMDGEGIAIMRQSYIEEADSVGSIPAPVSVKGTLKSGAQLIAGRRPQVFIDKLAERLAFERAGTRLYDALLAKFSARSEELADVSREDVLLIRNQEAQHFQLLKEAMEKLGADPTAQTPSADMVGVETMGLMQTVSDPRTSLAHSLHAALSAELIDNAGWDTLIVLAQDAGQEEMVELFTEAQQNEEEHLAKVTSWYESLVTRQSSVGGASE